MVVVVVVDVHVMDGVTVVAVDVHVMDNDHVVIRLARTRSAALL